MRHWTAAARHERDQPLTTDRELATNPRGDDIPLARNRRAYRRLVEKHQAAGLSSFAPQLSSSGR